MENKRQEILMRLGKLNTIQFIQPTARDLRSKRPLLARVERKNIELQKRDIEKQKSFLKKELGRVDAYLESVKKQEGYLKRKKAFEMNRSILPQGSAVTRSVFSEPAPTLLSRPKVVLGITPVRRRTRLSRYKQRYRRSWQQ